MTDEERGRRAQEILENDVFKGAVEDALKAVQAEWLICTDEGRRNDLWHKAQAINAVEGQLRKLRDAGVVARHNRVKADKR